MNCVENMLISVPHRNETFRTMFSKYPREVTEKAESLLEFVGLYEKRLLISGDLSFGQQNLVEFAMALMNEPEVLLLDEPTTGLDLTATFQYLETMRQLMIDGRTLVLVTHHIHEIPPEILRVVLLKDGEIFADGNKETVLTSQNLSVLYGQPIHLVQKESWYQAMPG